MMNKVAFALALIVAIEHIYIMVLEMFLIKTSLASRTFNLPKSFLEQPNVAVLFANQGLYNGFLAVGILLSLFAVPEAFQQMATLFFISCVVVAAIFGAMTSSKAILLKQGLPAILALIALIFL